MNPLLRGFLLFTFVLLGCGQSNPLPENAVSSVSGEKQVLARPLTDEDREVMVAVFRDLLPVSISGREVCFLSIGTDEKTRRYIDPPPEIIAALKDMRLDLRPASQGSIPEDDDRLDMTGLMVTDKRTGKVATVYSVTVPEWINPANARVVVEIYSSPHDASGFKAIVRKGENSWHIDKFDEWLTLAGQCAERQAS